MTQVTFAQAPAPMMGGQAPTPMMRGQAPTPMMGGQAPGMMMGGQAPGMTMGGQAPGMMMVATPSMGGMRGPCPMCGSGAPPLMVYEINSTGWIIFLIVLVLTCGVGGLIFLCWLCMDSQGDQCHSPVATCSACGMQRPMAMSM